MTNTKDRNDVQFRQFYQDLADLIRVWWEVYKLQLNNKEIPFASNFFRTETGMEVYPEFDMEKQIAIQATRGGVEKHHPVIEYYADGVLASGRLSLEKFIEEGALSEPYHVFRESWFTNELLRKVDANRKYSTILKDEFSSPLTALGAGLQTATTIIAQLVALSHSVDTLDPETVSLITSKVRAEYLPDAVRGIGLSNTPPMEERTDDYYLIDPEEPRSLSKVLLWIFDYGITVGCPASLRPSRECIEFLTKQGGVSEVKGTVTGELAHKMRENYPHYVLNWFNRLTPEQKETLIHPDHLNLLEGRITTGYE